MWNQPYLETCCRATLHRLILCGAAGRPTETKDGRCLLRLAGMGLACRREDGGFEITPAGRELHATGIAARG
jgi:hypothetical protein